MSHRHLIHTAAIGLAVAAVAAPTAVAQQQDLRSPDAADIAPSVTTQAQDNRSPDARDAADGRGTFTAPRVTVVRVAQPSSSAGRGFDWGDAGIGAGGILALVLIGLGGALVVVHRRHGTTPRGPAVS